MKTMQIAKMSKSQPTLNSINTKTCRICLSNNLSLCPLFKYNLNGNYAEMLTSIADVKVSVSDGLPNKICTNCCAAVEKAYLIKILAERSDRQLRKILIEQTKVKHTKKIAFNSLCDIRTKIAPFTVKVEPKCNVDLQDLNTDRGPIETMNISNIIIANTVIKKLDLKKEDVEDSKSGVLKNEPEENYNLHQAEDFFHYDEDSYDDEDYVPISETKAKFKKPKLDSLQNLKENKKPLIAKKRKHKVNFKSENVTKRVIDGVKSDNLITCYPVTRNGTRGEPILLRRPKDSTILKFGPYRKRGIEQSEPHSYTDKSVTVVRAKNGTREKEKLVCPVCGILTYALGNHMSTHQEKRKLTCNECPSTFTQKSNLIIHMKRHTGIKDHICDICNAGFYSPKGLIRHKLIHKGERPHECELCNKKFIARCDLTRHLRIHAGYKPYKCNVCAMSFNAKHQLQNHERMHTGERPYICQICSVSFSYKVNLNNHVSKVHGVNIKFKSIHIVTEEILRQEVDGVSETRDAVVHIIPHLTSTPDLTDNTIIVPHQSTNHETYRIST